MDITDISSIVNKTAITTKNAWICPLEDVIFYSHFFLNIWRMKHTSGDFLYSHLLFVISINIWIHGRMNQYCGWGGVCDKMHVIHSKQLSESEINDFEIMSDDYQPSLWQAQTYGRVKQVNELHKINHGQYYRRVKWMLVVNRLLARKAYYVG